MKPWQLPPQLDDLRPPQAWQFEQLRRQLLDALVAKDYQYIHPPLVEYTIALRATQPDANLCTLQELGGETLAVRADLTAQVARMDASLKPQSTTRYCYAGEVLHPSTDTLDTQRNPYQVGGECFGESNIKADFDNIDTVLACTQPIGLNNLTLDVCDTTLLASLIADTPEVLPLLQQRSRPDVLALAQAQNKPQLCALMNLNGTDFNTIKSDLTKHFPEASQNLKPLEQLAKHLSKHNIRVHFDLIETQGFGRYNGPSWRLFCNTTAIARGGRYDGIGERFSHARPAVGFSFDLNRILECLTP